MVYQKISVMDTEAYGTIGQRGPAVEHRELYSVSCVGKESEREQMCVYMYDWVTLLCSRDYHSLVG